MSRFIFVIIQWVFLLIQILIGRYRNKHENELTIKQNTFLTVAYFFCMGMVFLMLFLVLLL